MTAVDAGAAEEKPHTLDDVMIAMDVVDTLRHREDLVRRELNEEGREAELIARLREIYSEQGIAVPDDVLAQGVKALRESRFTYTPAPPSWTRTFLEMWATRRRLARRGAFALALIAALWGAYYFWVQRPAAEAERQARIEITQTLPRALSAAHADVLAMTTDDAARKRADALLADGERALRDNDPAAARRINASLNLLRLDLASEYTLTIVSRPGETTGVWRRPPRGSGRNYYVIVEPVASDGSRISVPIRNEETGQTESVSKFGVRVPQATYEAVAADKRDDGIVQNNKFGVKRRGKLDVDYLMPFEGGAITKW